MSDTYNLSNSQKEELIRLCQSLVKIKSYSGQEEEVAKEIIEYANQVGFDEIEVDKFGSILLTIHGKNKGPTVLFDGHIDTVPVDESKWDSNPFSGEYKDGKIYGRGSSDMKGAVSSMIFAAINYANSNDRNFNGKIVVSCSVQEEVFEGVSTRNISELTKPDFVIIGEATALNVNRGQRGRAEIIIETMGKPAHSSNPEKGINAVNKMMDLLEEINKLSQPKHPILGEGILELTDIKSSPYPGASVVPSNCRVTFDRRLLVNETKESVLEPIEDIIRKLKNKDSNFDAVVYYAKGEEKCYTNEIIKSERFFPAWLYDDTEEIVEKSYNAILKVNPNSKLEHYSFCTNGSHFAGEANIPTIGFGPSYEHLAHIDNEYVDVDQLFNATVGYIEIMKALTMEG